MSGRMAFPLLFAVCLYIILFSAIFSVYYTSPLVRGTPPIPMNITPLATHLIFIVADGLRADNLYKPNMPETPYIKDLLLNHGAWGISHTRVPTESRPGHVAMLGGFYEDVSSVTKGWQANAVEFDSVLNRSERAWAWGLHEVVYAFRTTEDEESHIKIIPSPAEFGDLAGENITAPDRWVLDQFLENIVDKQDGFYAPRASDKEKNEGQSSVTRRGRVAFLHLDAADLTGHAHKPGSAEYLHLLRHLDALVQKLVIGVERVTAGLGSNTRTAFIFTSDHGMTSWGSHGAGSFAETTTPLLVWGAGFLGPTRTPDEDGQTSHNLIDRDGLPSQIEGRLRRDIKQADLCPLMAGLLGAPIAVNSVGRIPFSLINTSDQSKVMMARANALQLVAQVELKREETRLAHSSLFFKDFNLLREEDIRKMLRRGEQFDKEKLFELAVGQLIISIHPIANLLSQIVEYEHLSELSLEALSYFHKYDRSLLTLCIGATYVLWSFLILLKLTVPSNTQLCSKLKPTVLASLVTTVISVIVVFLAIYVIVYAYWSPPMHTVCQLMPLALVFYLVCCDEYQAKIVRFLHEIHLIMEPRKKQQTDASFDQHRLVEYIPFACLVFALLECIIWGFHHRPLLSMACLIVASWPLVDKTFGMDRQNLRRLWSVACTGLALFPLLPVIGSIFSPKLVSSPTSAIHSEPGVILSILMIVLIAFSGMHSVLSRYFDPFERYECMSRVVCWYLKPILLALSSLSVAFIHSESKIHDFTRSAIHVYSWTMLILPSLAVLGWCPPILGTRLYAWTVAFLIPYVLLSTGYEIIFFLLFMTVGLLWIQLEGFDLKAERIWSLVTVVSATQSDEGHCLQDSRLTRPIIRQSIFFIFLLTISFFGTGNIASVNSFDPRSTYCFITQLKPAVMSIFLMIKVLTPMILLSLIYAAVVLVSQSQNPEQGHRAATQTSLCWVLSNFIAMHFFTWLRDEGSWLDIGTSISHYVIAMAIGLISVIFSYIGQLLFRICLCENGFQYFSQKTV